MLSFEQVNILGQILDTSFGQSSETYKCKATMLGENTLQVMFSTVAYLASERGVREQIPRISEEANHRIANLVKDCKQKYKDASGGSVLSLKELSNRDSVEYIQASYNNPRKVVLYRKFADFEIS